MMEVFYNILIQESFLMIALAILTAYILKSARNREERYLEIVENYNEALSNLSKNIEFIVEKYR